MRPIANTRRVPLTRSDWRLLVAASALQILTACALRTLSLATWRRAAARLRALARTVLDGPEERVIWAIEATGRRLPGVSTCLVRAVVAELALAFPDRPLRLMIGVRRVSKGDVRGHAWIVREGRVLIGGATADEYVPFAAWDSLFR